MSSSFAPLPAWLRDAVAYEIYPQSFCDSNGDGIGDLPGAISKLDYIKELGANLIWLNPCFDSPYRDAGYDVRDYYQVGERYGTNEDLVRFFEEAHARGIRVMLDLVPGHTSDEHPWFKASGQHERNEYTDWFIWNDSVWSYPEPPLRSIAGNAERDACYITNFFHFQPALNYGFANPDPNQPWQQPIDAPGPKAVRTEMRKVMKYWLDKGCDGFRVDMADSLIKGLGKETGMREIWGEIRTWIDEAYPEAVLLSEWSDPKHAIPSGFHLDFLIHFNNSAYTSLLRKPDGFGMGANKYAASFFDRSGRGSIREFLDIYEEAKEITTGLGYICLPSGNHDIAPRLAHRRNQADLEVIFAFLLTAPGIPFIYYGDEIGMQGVQGLPSKEGGYVRTQCRTPMQWDGSANAGFSTGNPEQFYLPLEPAADRPNAADQQADPASLRSFVQEMIKFRRENPALLADGEYTTLHAADDQLPYVYQRAHDGKSLIIALNPADRPAEVTLSADSLQGNNGTLMKGRGKLKPNADTLVLSLPPVSFGIWG